MTSALVDTNSLFDLANAFQCKRPESIKNLSPLIDSIVLCDTLVADGHNLDSFGLTYLETLLNGVLRLLDDENGGSPALRAVRQTRRPSHPDARANEDNYLLSTHHYLDLAQELDVYACLHPERVSYLTERFNGSCPKSSLAKILVRHFDSQMVDDTVSQIYEINFGVPPITDLVLQVVGSGADVVSAILEVRESRNAVAFRRWCSEFDDELRSLNGRSAATLVKKVIKEVDQAATRWNDDINLGVKYERRTLELKKLSLVGPLLEAIGIDQVSIPDPVIRPGKPHLLFLNDLYRPPKKNRAR